MNKMIIATSILLMSAFSIEALASTATITVLPPPTCGITSTDLIFGNLVPGKTTPSVSSTVSNTGNTATTELDIKGTQWTGIQGTMIVQSTSWNVVDNIWTALADTDANTGVNINSGSSKTFNFKVTVPALQPSGSYSQTVTFTGFC